MGARSTKSRRRLAEASPVMSYAPRAAKRVTVDLRADLAEREDPWLPTLEIPVVVWLPEQSKAAVYGHRHVLAGKVSSRRPKPFHRLPEHSWRLPRSATPYHRALRIHAAGMRQRFQCGIEIW
jgi:hypothetical protein